MARLRRREKRKTCSFSRCNWDMDIDCPHGRELAEPVSNDLRHEASVKHAESMPGSSSGTGWVR